MRDLLDILRGCLSGQQTTHGARPPLQGVAPMSQLIIELKNGGPVVVVEICPWEDEGTAYLFVEFYTALGTPNLIAIPESNSELRHTGFPSPYLAFSIGGALPIQVGLGDCAAFVSRQMSECKQLHAMCSSKKPGLCLHES